MSRPWVVTQNGRVICGARMNLNEAQARNKVENERRQRIFMEARPATDAEINPPEWLDPEELCDVDD